MVYNQWFNMSKSLPNLFRENVESEQVDGKCRMAYQSIHWFQSADAFILQCRLFSIRLSEQLWLTKTMIKLSIKVCFDSSTLLSRPLYTRREPSSYFVAGRQAKRAVLFCFAQARLLYCTVLYSHNQNIAMVLAMFDSYPMKNHRVEPHAFPDGYTLWYRLR